MGDGDDVGVNLASIQIVRSFDSSLTASFATRAVAILHSLGCSSLDAGIGASAGVGVGAAVGSGGVVFGGGSMVFGSGAIFGSGGSHVSGSGANRLHWVGPVMDSTVKPLLWWPGEGTKRLRRIGGS